MTYFCDKTRYLNKEVNCTEPSHSVSFPFTNRWTDEETDKWSDRLTDESFFLLDEFRETFAGIVKPVVQHFDLLQENNSFLGPMIG
jgi:hypothetical protein